MFIQKLKKIKLNHIQNKFLKKSLGKHLRLYKKNVMHSLLDFILI